MPRRAYLFLIALVLLLVLGGFNVVRKIRWQEPADGATWEARSTGLTAIRVEMDGPAELAGVKKGDVVHSINHNLVPDKVIIRTKIDLVRNLWMAGTAGQKVTYEIYREGEVVPLNFSMFLRPKGTSILYFYLALIGLTTLILALIVFLKSARPLASTHVTFYLLSTLLFAFYTFSPTGEFDLLDSVFFWLDKAAFLAFPPLLLHYFLLYPQRKKVLRDRPSLAPLLYAPAGILALSWVGLHLPPAGSLDSVLLLSLVGTLEKLDLGHFAAYTFATLAVIGHSTLRHSSFIVRRQLKWIVYGLGFGVVPFGLVYVLPFIAGYAPTQLAEMTILLQALIPLSVSYSISRYKLMDLEVIIKQAATLVFSYFVLALVYLGLSSQTKLVSQNRSNVVVLGIVAIILGATLFTPLRSLFQSLFDRVFYRRSYQYRKTLLVISQELSRERNLENLARRLLELIANALSLRTIALYLPARAGSRTFLVFSARGDFSTLPPSELALDPAVYETLRESDSLSLYSLTEDKILQAKLEALNASGFEHFLGLKVEDKLIGCLAMGRKLDARFLTSEDWELLTTISSPAALAVENASLYAQASARAAELERLKDYSENIIESLTVGVVVLDGNGRVIGWNRVLEGKFGRKKDDVLGWGLREVLGPESFSAIYPPDTLSDYQLLNEIPIEAGGGEKRVFDIARTPLLDNRLQPYGTIIVFEDITDKVRLQQQLVTSEKLASIGLLSAGVAHEINTPLTGISSYVQMLQKKASDAHFAQILEKIEAQTDRVSRIIKNLLSFARNPSDLAFHRVGLRDSLQEIISLIDYKLKAMSIALDLELAPVKPIWAQGERLQQVFINIILNAIDAMPGGGRLSLSLSETASEAVVGIADTGTGIKEQHLPRIFDPFFTTKGIGKGTGLGLSISYAIVKEHEGRIDVQSEVGKGTKFTIVLPKDLDRRKSAKGTP
ncbi:MAG: PDZ domain-containing protein [Candidatus Aminicenantes bacterium]|nr:PDZ domain-containing protein [Candidatus Aminicenantes bacterium]